MKLEIKCVKTDKKVLVPCQLTSGTVGISLYAANEVDIHVGEVVSVSAGIKISVPVGFEAQIRSRSKLAYERRIMLANGVGTIDNDYRDEVKVMLHNLGDRDYRVQRGEKIAKLVIVPVVDFEMVMVDELPEFD